MPALLRILGSIFHEWWLFIFLSHISILNFWHVIENITAQHLLPENFLWGSRLHFWYSTPPPAPTLPSPISPSSWVLPCQWNPHPYLRLLPLLHPSPLGPPTIIAVMGGGVRLMKIIKWTLLFRRSGTMLSASQGYSTLSLKQHWRQHQHHQHHLTGEVS